MNVSNNKSVCFNDSSGIVYNELGYPIQCRGRDNANYVANTWCPDKYYFSHTELICKLPTYIPCLDNCSYVKNLSYRVYKNFTSAYGSFILDDYLANESLWQEYLNQYVFYKSSAYGSYSCFLVDANTSRRKMSCALLSLWPVETYSFQNISVYYTGYGVQYPHKTDPINYNTIVSGTILDPIYVYGAYGGLIFFP